MAVNASSIVVGKCYATAKNQHRRVLKIDPTLNKVTYESWGGNVGANGNLSRTTVGLNKFATDVDKEITCPSKPKPPAPKKDEEKKDEEKNDGENNV